jgi:hypothetical protein
MKNKEFVVWALQETALEWIEWCDMGSADTIEGAREVASKCGWTYWRIRLNTETDPSYVVGGWDDGKWVE